MDALEFLKQALNKFLADFATYKQNRDQTIADALANYKAGIVVDVQAMADQIAAADAGIAPAVVAATAAVTPMMETGAVAAASDANAA